MNRTIRSAALACILFLGGLSARGSVVTLYTTITNQPGNGDTNAVSTYMTNNLVLTWTNGVATNPWNVQIGVTVAQSMTNEYRWFSTNYGTGTWLSRGIVATTPTNTFALSSLNPITNAVSAGSATNWFVTNAPPFVNTMYGQVEFPDGSIQSTASSGGIANVVTNNFIPNMIFNGNVAIAGTLLATNTTFFGNNSLQGTTQLIGTTTEHGNLEVQGTLTADNPAKLNFLTLTNGLSNQSGATNSGFASMLGGAGVTGGLTADVNTLGGVTIQTNLYFSGPVGVVISNALGGIGSGGLFADTNGNVSLSPQNAASPVIDYQPRFLGWGFTNVYGTGYIATWTNLGAVAFGNSGWTIYQMFNVTPGDNVTASLFDPTNSSAFSSADNSVSLGSGPVKGVKVDKNANVVLGGTLTVSSNMVVPGVKFSATNSWLTGPTGTGSFSPQIVNGTNAPDGRAVSVVYAENIIGTNLFFDLISDTSLFTDYGTSGAFAMVDGYETFSGTNHYSHIRTIQSRPNFNGSAGADEVGAVDFQLNVVTNSGIPTVAAVHVHDSLGAYSNTVGLFYGLLVDPLYSPTNSYVFYSGGPSQAYMNGLLQVGTGGNFKQAGWTTYGALIGHDSTGNFIDNPNLTIISGVLDFNTVATAQIDLYHSGNTVYGFNTTASALQEFMPNSGNVFLSWGTMSTAFGTNYIPYVTLSSLNGSFQVNSNLCLKYDSGQTYGTVVTVDGSGNLQVSTGTTIVNEAIDMSNHAGSLLLNHNGNIVSGIKVVGSSAGKFQIFNPGGAFPIQLGAMSTADGTTFSENLNINMTNGTVTVDTNLVVGGSATVASLIVSHGTNKRSGTAVLSGGTVVVPNTTVASGDYALLSYVTTGTQVGILSAPLSLMTNGSAFVINSSYTNTVVEAGDTNIVAWLLYNQN